PRRTPWQMRKRNGQGAPGDEQSLAQNPYRPAQPAENPGQEAAARLTHWPKSRAFQFVLDSAWSSDLPDVGRTLAAITRGKRLPQRPTIPGDAITQEEHRTPVVRTRKLA